MEPRNFHFFSKIVQKSLIILPFVPDAFWKPPRASPEPSLSPQEALQSLQEPPFRLPRGLREAGLQSFLHFWTEDYTSTTKAQCHPRVHTFAVYESDYNADLSALFQWSMTKHQKQRCSPNGFKGGRGNTCKENKKRCSPKCFQSSWGNTCEEKKKRCSPNCFKNSLGNTYKEKRKWIAPLRPFGIVSTTDGQTSKTKPQCRHGGGSTRQRSWIYNPSVWNMLEPQSKVQL